MTVVRMMHGALKFITF